MPRKVKRTNAEADPQLPLDFETLINNAQVLSKEEVAAQSPRQEGQPSYDPIAQTAGYMQRTVEFEQAWETTIQAAREQLLNVDARQLYFDFFLDLKRQIESNSPQALRLAHLLDLVAVQGLGMGRDKLHVIKPSRGGARWKIHFDESLVEAHLNSHIVGNHFLHIVDDREIKDQNLDFLIGASDVSQHRSAVPVPARYFKRSVPFVLNNAAGTLFRHQDGEPKYDNVFNPKPDEELLRWMLIDPSYQDELEPEDYQRCTSSAMDVGQYKFDREFLLKAAKRAPDIIFRDGSLFPQDAYLDNYLIENKRGDFTREAIKELLDCLSYAERVEVIYCGVSKNVQLKVYSAVVDWYIAKNIDRNWEIGNYTLNDGQAMSLLLSSPSFIESNLHQALATCLIRRSFTTRANLHTRLISLAELDDHFRRYQERTDIDIKPYKSLCNLGHFYMFFIGHSKSPQQQLPRYEFFYTDSFGSVSTIAQKVLLALRSCGFTTDHDHSFMADKPITYLIPSVTQHAHHLSKHVGSYIDTATGAWIMSRYARLLPKKS
jgi:hypothetical protein